MSKKILRRVVNLDAIGFIIDIVVIQIPVCSLNEAGARNIQKLLKPKFVKAEICRSGSIKEAGHYKKQVITRRTAKGFWM